MFQKNETESFDGFSLSNFHIKTYQDRLMHFEVLACQVSIFLKHSVYHGCKNVGEIF